MRSAAPHDAGDPHIYVNQRSLVYESAARTPSAITLLILAATLVHEQVHNTDLELGGLPPPGDSSGAGYRACRGATSTRPAGTSSDWMRKRAHSRGRASPHTHSPSPLITIGIGTRLGLSRVIARPRRAWRRAVAGEQRERPAVAAGAVHLPARRAVRLGDLDHAPRVGVNERRVQLGLCGGVVAHGPSQRVEVAREQCVARPLRGCAQGLERSAVRPRSLQTAHDLFVDGRRTVRPAEVDERQPPVQFPANRIGERQRRHDRPRVVGDLDEVGAAERGAELILDAALPPEVNGLDGVRGAGNLVRRATASASRSSAPSRATTTAADVPVDAPAGASDRIVTSMSASSGGLISRNAASSSGCGPQLDASRAGA